MDKTIQLDKRQVLARLRAMAPELKARGVESLSLFGSLARGEAEAGSDIDIAVRFADSFATGGFEFFGKFDDLRLELSERLGTPVDLVEEPVRRKSIQAEIERDRVIAF
jgi:predicted nucleotidyltransferase